VKTGRDRAFLYPLRNLMSIYLCVLFCVTHRYVKLQLKFFFCKGNCAGKIAIADLLEV